MLGVLSRRVDLGVLAERERFTRADQQRCWEPTPALGLPLVIS